MYSVAAFVNLRQQLAACSLQGVTSRGFAFARCAPGAPPTPPILGGPRGGRPGRGKLGLVGPGPGFPLCPALAVLLERMVARRKRLLARNPHSPAGPPDGLVQTRRAGTRGPAPRCAPPRPASGPDRSRAGAPWSGAAALRALGLLHHAVMGFLP